MVPLESLSIQLQLKETDRIDPKKVHKLRQQLLHNIQTPEFKTESKNLLYNGDTVSFSMNDCSIPIINLFTGKLEKGNHLGTGRLYVSLNSINGSVLVPCSWNEKKNEFSFKIPKGTVHSIAILLVPGIEYIGPESDERIRKFTQCQDCEDEKKYKMGLAGSAIVIPQMIGFFRIACGICRDTAGSICPNNNIKFDQDGYCYVDEEICKGQYKITVQPGQTTEVPCWECFSPNNNGAFSDLCLFGYLQKVLRIEYWCCGCCKEINQVIPGVCLKELCAQNAIHGGFPTQYVSPDGTIYDCARCPNQLPPEEGANQSYQVYQDKCIGCMVCYNNTRCEKVKMKAHIKKIRSVMFSAKSLTLRPIYPEIPDLSELKLVLGVWGELRGHTFMDEIPVNLGVDLHTEINRNFEFDRTLQFAIYALNNRGSRITLSGNVQPAIHSFYFPGNNQIPPQLEFATRFGRIYLELDNLN